MPIWYKRRASLTRILSRFSAIYPSNGGIMSEKIKDNELYAWAKEYREFDLTAWERLPDIELYMDQVISYLDRMLHLQERCDGAPLLTASMVNNYVKGGYIPRPNQKRYSRAHIAALYILCSAKQNLSVPDAAALLSLLQKSCTIDCLYTLFGERQREIAEELTELLTKDEALSSDELLNFALDLTLRASAENLMAERILDHLKKEEAKKHEKELEKEKEKTEKEAKEKTVKEAKEKDSKKEADKKTTE